MQFVPHNYQKYSIQRIINDPAYGAFLRPGLGKTVITLSAILELRYFRFAIKKALIIAPKKVAEATWGVEAKKWDHTKMMRVQTVLGSATSRIKALNTPADVYVISRDNVCWLVDYYKQAWPFDMLVVDESTSFKNPNSKRFKALKLIRRFCKKVVILTGTPSSQNIANIWSQVYLLDGGERLGRTLGQFRGRYFNVNTHGGHYTDYEPKKDAERAILKAVGDICVSMKAEDYLELPECVERVVPVELDSKSKKAYETFEKQMLLEIDDDTLTAQGAAALTNKLLQFCNGAVYNDDKNMVVVHDNKLDAYEELLESLQGEPAITFYGYQHDRIRILERLGGKGLRVREYKGPKDADDWNNGQIDVLLAHPASCAYGLNLQAGGRHIVWYGLNWSFELNDQAKCRLWRQGSTYDKVFVHHLVVQDSMDEAVMSALSKRGETHETVMDALKARIEKTRKQGLKV